jgi:hypothetical protein
METTMPNRAAFTHKPKFKGPSVFVDSSGPLFKAIFAAAKAQDWWEDDVGMVMGNEYDKFYFQIPGLTTGYACLDFDVVAFLRTLDSDPRTAMIAAGVGGSLNQVLAGGDVYSKGTKKLWETLNA